MKQIFVFILLIWSGSLSAQMDTSSQCYKQQHIPFFTLYKSDSSTFIEKDLKPKTKTIFMLFSPDCEHCQKQVEMMLKNKDVFKNAQVVMVTTASLQMIKDFEEKYKIKDYPFITAVCRDPKLFFGVFFKLKQVPMLAFYGSDFNIKKIYNNGATMKQIKAALAQQVFLQ